MTIRDDSQVRQKLGLSLQGKSCAGTANLGKVLLRSRVQEKPAIVYPDKDVIECQGIVRSSASKHASQTRDDYKARVWVSGPDGRPVQVTNVDLYSQHNHSLPRAKDVKTNKASPFPDRKGMSFTRKVSLKNRLNKPE